MKNTKRLCRIITALLFICVLWTVCGIGQGMEVFANASSAIFPRSSSWFSTKRNDRVWAADVTGDGKVDFVGISDSGSIFTSVNKGEFTFGAMEYSGGSGFESYGWLDPAYNRRMWVVDINGDSKADIVGIDFAGNICYALSKGDGKFESLKVIYMSSFPTASGWFSTQRVDRVWPADINGDGYVDIIGMDDFGSIYTFVNKQNFTFESRKESKIGGWLYKSGWFNTSINSNIWPGDFNGDGNVDIMAVDSVGAVSYALSRGDGSFETIKHILSGAFPTSSGWYHPSVNARVWPADITGDGKADFIGVAGGVYTTLGAAHNARRVSINGAFPEHAWFNVSINNRVWTGDIDGDGKKDIVSISDSGSIKYALSKGDGTFGNTAEIFPGYGENSVNNYKPYTAVTNRTSGTSWPTGQAIPTFATPASTLDSISVNNLSDDEEITFTALQGLINKQQPRMLILDANPDEGSTTWSNTFGFTRTTYNNSNKYNIAGKYKSEIKGIVVYSTEKSSHYRNLAASIANAKGYIPVTESIKNNLTSAGVSFSSSNTIDITGLTYTSATSIYNYLYDNYWKDCTKRLLISASPDTDLNHTRDMAAATGAAVVYLDCTNSTQKTLYQKFLKDMKPGNALVMGWFTTERSGIIAGTECGISTVPADLFISSTVYAGTDHKIQIPVVPARPALENKLYIAVYVTDGDNVQYVQRAMRKIWGEQTNDRGKVAINWTISPALVDLAPGMMNYYYNLASDKECFVAGPSGMGYFMPINTLAEPGAPNKDFVTNKALMDPYTALTETYMQRAGLRALTIWDNASTMQRSSFENNCRYLYGATVQLFGSGSVSSSVANNRLAFIRHETAYESSYETLRTNLRGRINSYSGSAPEFLSYQVNVWSGEVRTSQLVQLYNELKASYPNKKFEFVRADHFYSYYNEAKKLPYNLCMSSATKVTGSSSSTETVKDGTPVSMWTSTASSKWLQFDFGRNYSISRYVIRHAGENGMSKSYNTYSYAVQVSNDGKAWSTVDTYSGNTENVTDINLSSVVSARYLRILIDNPGSDGTARIADVEIYGKVP